MNLRVRFILYTVLFTALISSGLACSSSDSPDEQAVADSNRPEALISSPVEGETLNLGETVKVTSTSRDERGIVRVELVVNDQVVRVDANPEPAPDTPYLVAQPWTPEATGSYVIQVRAYNTANIAGESEPVVVKVAVVAQAAENKSPKATLPASTATATTTPSPTFTAQPTQPSPTSTPTPGRTSEPTPVPLASFTPTGFKPQSSFAKIWDNLGGGASQLGYPTAPGITERDFAYQYFEKGVMYWWDNPDDENFIWAMESVSKDDYWQGVAWNRYADTWEGGNLYSCDAAQQNKIGPMRGFGKVWCEKTGVFEGLGYPSKAEYGSGGTPPLSIVQFFQGGVMLYNPFGSEVFVLFNQGGWQRFPAY